MVGRLQNPRPSSTRVSATASRKAPGTDAKRPKTTRRTSTSTSWSRKAHVDVIHAEANSVHSSDNSRNESEASVDVVSDSEANNVNLSSKISIPPAAAATSFVDVDVKMPEPYEDASQSSQPSRTTQQLSGDPSDRKESITCVSDPDEKAYKPSSVHICPPGTTTNTGAACISSDEEEQGSASIIAQTQQQPQQHQPIHLTSFRGLARNASSIGGSRSSSPAMAPILSVSRLTDYFAYGFQAAMTHYTNHFCDEGEEMATSGTILPSKAGARYHNSFLTELLPHTREENTTLSGRASRSSSATTYDSDTETEPRPLRTANETQKTTAKEEAVDHFLEPQVTSLYRAPPSTSFSQSAGGESWSGAAPRTAAPTTEARKKSLTTALQSYEAPVSSALPSEGIDWRSGGALACFGEALRRACACEDAVRQWRRDEVNNQRAQLIKALTRLQGDTSSSSSGANTSNSAECGHVEKQEAEQTGVGCRLLARQDTKQLSAVSINKTVSSSLSNIGHFVGSTGETPDVKQLLALSSETNTRNKLVNGENRKSDGAEQLYVADDDDNRNDELSARDGRTTLFTTSLKQQMGAFAALAATTPSAVSAPSRHLLQVIDPSELYKLRRTPNILVDTLLKHHKEAQRKQLAVQHSEDQAVHARRLYELPILTEDIVRYAALLLCLKRSQKRSVQMTANSGNLTDNSDRDSPSTLPSGAASLCSPWYSTSPLTSTAATAAAVTIPRISDAVDSLPPYGEDGSLLYMKYPAPLLRTTSFAVETVRLLRWLRTWRNSRSSLSGNFSSPPPPPPVPKTPIERRPRARVKTESLAGTSKNTETSVKGQSSTSIELAPSSPSCIPAEIPHTQRSPIEEADRQIQRAQKLLEAQVKQEKRSAFLKFFGAAVAPPSIKQECDTTLAEAETLKTERGVKSANSAEAPAPSSAAKVIPDASSPTRHRITKVQDNAVEVKEDEEQVVVQQTQSESTTAFPPLHSTDPRPPPSQLIYPAVYAYQLYCYAWRHAVKTGITPLATAAQAFAGSRDQASALCPKLKQGKGAGSTAGGAVSRVCAALPFYKEMQAEAQRTALGSAARGVYYEDVYGNRLRSARLAQKEQEKQAQLAAQRRRLAKRRGYFHRNNNDEGGMTSRSAAAMLETMLLPTADFGSSDRDASSSSGSKSRSDNEKHTQKRKSKRVRDASSEDESPRVCAINNEDNSSEAVKTSGTGNTHRRRENGRCRRAPSNASDASSCSKSSYSSSGSDAAATEDEEEVAGSKDEITNIAVVSGPTGAGKTAAVYVAAQLLGFRVVEMNAAVKRCPKTVEHLLAELTRSYRLSGLRSGPSGFNVEEELMKLKHQHAVMMEKARAEAEAVERETEQKKREARKANCISAQAVANFFSRKRATSEKTAKQQQSVVRTNVDESAEDDAVVQVPPPDPPLSSLSAASSVSPPLPRTSYSSLSSPASPAPSQTTAAPPVETCTLLLFEDADILLGDESAKPFYAAIRDLAHRSKVPIVVTVSADPSPAQRYDTSLFVSSATLNATSSTGTKTTENFKPPLQQTYWELCEAAGLNTPMDSLEAAYSALHASPVLGDRVSNAVTNENGINNGGGGPDNVSNYSGGNPPQQSGNNTAVSLMSFFSPSNTTIGCSGGLSGVAAGNISSGPGTGSSHPTSLGNNNNPSATGGTAASANSLTPRYTHMLLNASLVSNFFGSQTPFTVVNSLPPSALFAQLLAVGAVELNLLQWQSPPNLRSPLVNGDASMKTNEQALLFTQLITTNSQQQSSQVPPMPSSSSWQQDMDRITDSLTLRDPDLFFELAAHLCHALFGVPTQMRAEHVTEAVNEENECSSQAQKRTPFAGPGLATAIQCDAAGRTTTDIRYWLNRLQMLLLALKSRHSTQNPTEAEALKNREKDNTVCKIQEEVQDRQQSETDAPEGREAERLLENEFQHYTSFAASAWDKALGQYVSQLAHNELHSSRYEYWLLDSHVDYVTDIVGELNTQDHPTLGIDYTPEPDTKVALPSPQAVQRRGQLPSSQRAANAKNSGKGCSHSALGAGSQMDAAVRGLSLHPNPTLNKTTNEGGSCSGLNPAWKAFFGGAKGSATVAGPADNPTTKVTSSAPMPAGVRKTLCGSPRGPLTAEVPSNTPAASPGVVVDVPARYEWPPTLHELCKQANRYASNSSGVHPITTPHLRPIELILPYSTAQTYYDAIATSASSATSIRVPDVAEPSPLLLGHDTPLRFVNRQGGLEMVEEEGDYCDMGGALPSSVHVTQEERFGVFRRWWRRTRKVGALRDVVAGRSPAVLEDILGHSCLLSPSTATNSGNGSST